MKFLGEPLPFEKEEQVGVGGGKNQMGGSQGGEALKRETLRVLNLLKENEDAEMQIVPLKTFQEGGEGGIECKSSGRQTTL